MNGLNGRSAKLMLDEFSELKRRYLGQYLLPRWFKFSEANLNQK